MKTEKETKSTSSNCDKIVQITHNVYFMGS